MNLPDNSFFFSASFPGGSQELAVAAEPTQNLEV